MHFAMGLVFLPKLHSLRFAWGRVRRESHPSGHFIPLNILKKSYIGFRDVLFITSSQSLVVAGRGYVQGLPQRED